MRTQMIIQTLTTLGLAGLLVGAKSDAEFISGERALLNRIETAPVSPASSHHRPIDATRALLGRVVGNPVRQGIGSAPSDAAPAPIGAERALLGRGA